MENASPLTTDPSLLQFYYDKGLRVLGLVHFKNNDFADSATDQPEWHGLSPAGRALVAEANRMGLLIDQSHASDDVFDQLLELSKAPIVLTHSSSRAVFDHPRNLDDERLRRLAASGGVIQVELLPHLCQQPRGRAHLRRLHGACAAHPEVAGPDHVGFGADWDGGGGVMGMEDITALPKITARLLAAGYTEEQIGNMWSGNLLRVLGEAQRIGRELQSQQGAQSREISHAQADRWAVAAVRTARGLVGDSGSAGAAHRHRGPGPRLPAGHARRHAHRPAPAGAGAARAHGHRRQCAGLGPLTLAAVGMARRGRAREDPGRGAAGRERPGRSHRLERLPRRCRQQSGHR